MKNTIALLLALAFQAGSASATAVLAGNPENTNMLARFTSVAIADAAGGLPDIDKPGNPFARDVADNNVGHHMLASADDDYLIVAAVVGPTSEDAPFLDDDDEVLEVYDPLETFNRGMFWFNDKLYFYLMKPVARAYRWIAPETFRVMVGNVFSNLETPIRMINAGLQGKFDDAGNELLRFGTNSTIGILGLFDPAKEHFGIEEKNEDTGQTLGHYGIGPGPYLVLPFWGPSSVRDGIGQLADSQMNLLSHLLENQDYYGTVVLRGINTLSLDKDTYEGIKKDALDPYLFVRDAFNQYRKNLVEN